jgi:formate dehydrogenase
VLHSPGSAFYITSPTASVQLEALVSDVVTPGVIVIAHGWGSRVFDPRGGVDPVVFGVNRNSLVSNEDLDPLSQVSPLNSTCVRVELVQAEDTDPSGGDAGP